MRGNRILMLGGTTEAKALAGALARDPRFDTMLSLAGRTLDPQAQPVPVRVGGFGGAEGLEAYLRAEGIGLLIDATHPFADRISANAAVAAKAADVPVFALHRPGWERRPGDIWTGVASVADAVHALGNAPRRVFLAIGRQEAFAFSLAPQHSYLVRSVDPVEPGLDVPDATYILARGPFGESAEHALLAHHRIDVIVAKNSGGSATYGKIAAARTLGIEVVMVERRKPADVIAVETVEAALRHIDHVFSSRGADAMKRGV